MESLIALVVQLISGAVGGNAAGAALKDVDLGTLGNSIVGAIGGGIGGQLLTALLPALTGGGGLDVGALLGEIAGGGAGGALLTIIAGLVKNMAAGQQPS
jgi:hypothetical protein